MLFRGPFIERGRKRNIKEKTEVGCIGGWEDLEGTGMEKDYDKVYYMKKSNIKETNYDKILLTTFIASLNRDF